MSAAAAQRIGSSRGAALRFALRGLFRKPLTLAVSALCTAMVVAAAILIATAAWRAWPPDRPAWAVPSALVFAARSERLADLDTLRGALRQAGPVMTVEFVGRDAARAALVARKSLADSGLNDLQPNPLPNAFIVRFDPAATPAAIEEAVAAMRTQKGVAAVAYEPGTARKLDALTHFATRAGMLLGLVLLAALVAGFSLIADLWPRVALRLDPEELRVFQILGMEPAALRRPYVYAGAISMALAGALAAAIVLWAGARLAPVFAELATEYSLRWTDAPAPLAFAWLLCPAGGLLGAALASLATRSALRRAAPAR